MLLPLDYQNVLFLQHHLNVSVYARSAHLFHPILVKLFLFLSVSKITSPLIPDTNDISSLRLLSHTNIQTPHSTPVGIHHTSSWHLFNADPTEYIPVPLVFPLTLRAQCQWLSRSPTYIKMSQIWYTVSISTCLLFVSADQSVGQSQEFLYATCVYVCMFGAHMQTQGFLFLLLFSKPCTFSLHGNKGERGGFREVVVLTSWHLLSRGTPTISNSACICLCARLCMCAYFLMCD